MDQPADQNPYENMDIIFKLMHGNQGPYRLINQSDHNIVNSLFDLNVITKN